MIQIDGKPQSLGVSDVCISYKMEGNHQKNIILDIIPKKGVFNTGGTVITGTKKKKQVTWSDGASQEPLSLETSDKLDGFPSKGYKRTAKKMPADAYVEIVVNLKDKMVGHPADPEELNEEREMRFELISELTIYDGKQNIINESTSNHTQNIEALFAEEYSTELRENGTFVVKRPYFTQEDIISIFEIVKEDYLSTEN